MTAPLTNDQVISLTPAAGSMQHISGVSSRYSFVPPPLTAVDLLRDVLAGFQSMQSRALCVLPGGRDTNGILSVLPRTAYRLMVSGLIWFCTTPMTAAVPLS